MKRLLWLFCCLLLAHCVGPAPTSCEGGGCEGEPPSDCAPGCPPTQLCAAGACVDECPHGTRACGGACVDPSSDVRHCGGCQSPCAPGESCIEGRCYEGCEEANRLECGGSCVDPHYDRAHCGACESPCTEGEFCSEGRCDNECKGARPDVCGARCVDQLTDPSACGSCEVQCVAGQLCSEGRCSGRCDGRTPDQCGARCVDLRSDAAFCGDCGTRCLAGEVCSEGRCQEACGGPTPEQCGTLCVNLETDARFCGDCRTRCGPGEHCQAGECVDGCPDPEQRLCAGSCTDVKGDPEHCGACGAACRAGSVCSEGICAKSCGSALPDACAGACTDTQKDPKNCGQCGSTCASHEVCQKGDCQPSCGGSTPDVCLGGCVDLASDPRHCGRCGNVCDPGAVCSEGKCKAVCPAAQALCAGTCVDTLSSSAHCGACGRACESGQHCRDARCVETAVDVVSGASAICATLANGQQSCWGDNQYHAVGPGLSAPRHTSARLSGFAGPVLQVALGWAHGCALVEGPDGRLVQCWGSNWYGQTSGDETTTPDARVVPLPEEEIPAGVACSYYGSCAWMESGSVWCWGRIEASVGAQPVPAQVPSVAGVAALSGGGYQMCARLGATHDFAVQCWTATTSGVATVAGLTPPPAGISLRDGLSAGGIANCVIGAEGEVLCWGGDTMGVLGRGEDPVDPPLVPSPVLGLPGPARAVAVGYYHACAVLADDSLACWGRHQVGHVDAQSSTAEIILPGGVQRLAPHMDTNVLLMTSGDLMSWGGRELEMLNRSLSDKFQPTACCDSL